MINYLKNQGNYKAKDFTGMSYDEIRPIFYKVWDSIQAFTPIDFEKEEREKKTGGRKKSIGKKSVKRSTEKETQQESSKRHKIKESSASAEVPLERELTEEELQDMMTIIPEEGMNIEALQTKYPIVDWEVYIEDTRRYWKITRLRGHTGMYKHFDKMLKVFDRNDLDKLWELVKERYSSMNPAQDKEIELWVELKRLYEPDPNDELWDSQKHIYRRIFKWKLYESYGVHHVSTETGIDIYIC